MHNITKKDNEGFTIIEVVLVLAIAGLIFLVVFLALPQLQESRRDNQRRRVVELMSAKISSYKASNGGMIPSESLVQTSDWQSEYISNLEDPSTGTMTVSNSIPEIGRLQYVTNERCDGSVATTGGLEDVQDFAIVVQLEQSTYCLDNS